MSDNLIIQNDKQLAEQINTEHKAVIDGLRASLDHAIKAGELLLDAKRIAGHGNWLEWLHTNCQFSERTAQNYIKLAENKERLSNTQRVADLSYREAIALLTERVETDGHELEPGEIDISKYFQTQPTWINKVKLSQTGLKCSNDLTFEEWVNCGEFLRIYFDEIHKVRTKLQESIEVG